MGNWGVPDFTPSEKVDADAVHLRASLTARGLLTEWPSKYVVQAGYSPADVQLYCVQDKEWQQVRLSMKGKPTHEKLEILESWWLRNHNFRKEVQVGNYLGALRRGGQLDAQNRVRKYI